MKNFDDFLKGGDLRSIGKANEVVKEVNTRNDFDALFKELFHNDRKIVMRTTDAIEKVTLTNHKLLNSHKKEILELCYAANNIELKWHLALFVTRLKLTTTETRKV